MKSVLITGANRGLGLGFTRHYLGQGWRVYAAARKPEKSSILETLKSDFEGYFYALKLDVGQQAEVAMLPSQLDGVTLDLAINNAGICHEENLESWSAATFASTLTTNVTGPALVAKAISPLMKPGSVLVNISSGMGSCELNINPDGGLDAYAASKAALNLLTRRLASKLEPRGVTVIAIDPGWVRTRMGGEDADLTVDESVGDITATIAALAPADSGRFMSRKGVTVPW